SNSADLAVTKSSPAGTITEGTSLTYTLTVTNNGPSDAVGVTLTDPLPASVNFASASFSQGTFTVVGGTVTAALGTIPAGGTATGTIVVVAREEGTANNTASVTSSTPDANTANNSASAANTVTEATLTGTGVAVNGFERSPLTNVIVATFNHANGAEPATDFTATINWGGGATTAGTVG